LSTGVIFIAGDTHVGNAYLDATNNNPPGATWFLTLPTATGSSTGGLVRGPDDKDRFYGSSVLFQQRDDFGATQHRVIVVGGSEGCMSGDTTYCNGSIEVLRSVKELVFNGTNPAASTFVDKVNLLSPRVFSNAVILPTGDIFISRGSLTDFFNSPPGT